MHMLLLNFAQFLYGVLQQQQFNVVDNIHFPVWRSDFEIPKTNAYSTD